MPRRRPEGAEAERYAGRCESLKVRKPQGAKARNSVDRKECMPWYVGQMVRRER